MVVALEAGIQVDVSSQPAEAVLSATTSVENAPDSETVRLLDYFDKYSSHELQECRLMPFMTELDEVEIRNALREFWARNRSRLYAADVDQVSLLGEERQAILGYHAGLAERKKRGETELARIEEVGLAGALQDIHKLREFLADISDDWSRSFFAFLRRRGMEENRYINIEEEFGGEDISKVDKFFETPVEARDQLLDQYPELLEAYHRFYIDQYPNLTRRLREAEQALDAYTGEHPEEIRNLLTRLHASDEEIDSKAIDEILGIDTRKIEAKVDNREMQDKYGREQYQYQGTPYELIRAFLKDLNLSSSDVLYDLGCGYGRIPLYGAMTTPAKYRGIEIVSERVTEATAIKDKFALNNVEFREGNVLEQDYSDGNVFFLFNPFTRATLEQVSEKLKGLAKTKKIKVVSLGPSTGFFQSQDWLRPVESGSKEHPWSLEIFESV